MELLWNCFVVFCHLFSEFHWRGCCGNAQHGPAPAATSKPIWWWWIVTAIHFQKVNLLLYLITYHTYGPTVFNFVQPIIIFAHLTFCWGFLFKKLRRTAAVAADCRPASSPWCGPLQLTPHTFLLGSTHLEYPPQRRRNDTSAKCSEKHGTWVKKCQVLLKNVGTCNMLSFTDEDLWVLIVCKWCSPKIGWHQ